jgi:hypothetical protein
VKQVSGNKSIHYKDPDVMEEASHLRIQTPDGEDVVSINLENGHLEIADPERMGDAARAFWDAVQTIWVTLRVNDPGLDPHFTDFILRGGETVPHMGGRMLLRGGSGTPGGDIKIFLPQPLEKEQLHDLTGMKDQMVTECHVDDEVRAVPGSYELDWA